MWFRNINITELENNLKHFEDYFSKYYDKKEAQDSTTLGEVRELEDCQRMIHDMQEIISYMTEGRFVSWYDCITKEELSELYKTSKKDDGTATLDLLITSGYNDLTASVYGYDKKGDSFQKTYGFRYV